MAQLGHLQIEVGNRTSVQGFPQILPAAIPVDDFGKIEEHVVSVGPELYVEPSRCQLPPLPEIPPVVAMIPKPVVERTAAGTAG